MALVTAASDSRKPAGKNQLGVALLVLVLVAAVGAGLYFLLKSDKKNGANGQTGKCEAVSAAFLSSSRMQSESLIINQGFYWAGPIAGLKTEFRRTAECEVYVRYMPRSARLGEAGEFLVISTYPGYNVASLEKQARKEGARIVSGPRGSSIYVSVKRPRSVYMAFPSFNAQVEIFGQTAPQAVQFARSGKIRIAS